MIKNKVKSSKHFKQKRTSKLKNVYHIKKVITYQKINKINTLYYHNHKSNIQFLYVSLIFIYTVKKNHTRKEYQYL